MNDRGHWHWNANTTWHYFSSMYYSATAASEACDDFTRYHHLRTCIYFSVGTVESFLNQEMRRHLEENGTAEDLIHSTLRKGKLETKLKKWPSEITGKDLQPDTTVMQILEEHQAIRNEVTHPKRRDHSIYLDLDSVDTLSLVRAVAETMISVTAAKQKAFPYWLTGWNYVGFNGDPAAIMQGNNGNGFYWSLSFMGFNGLGDSLNFEGRHMVTTDHYRCLLDALKQYPDDIEPYAARFPQRPRLSKRWWDRKAILENVRQAQAVAETQ